MNNYRENELILSGDLSTIHGSLYSEAHLISAKIIQISTSCRIVPAALFSIDEEEKIVFNSEGEISLEDLTQDANWVTYLPGLTKSGTISHKEHSFFSQYMLNQEQEEEILQNLIENDPEKPSLSSIVSDDSEISFSNNWNFRIFGEKIQSINPNGGSKQTVLATNSLWKGAYSYYCCETKTSGFFYSGYGLKTAQSNIVKRIQSLLIPPVDSAYAPEYPEPNPQNEMSEKLETDSEDENYD